MKTVKELAEHAFALLMDDEDVSNFLNAKANEATGRSPTLEQKEDDSEWWNARAIATHHLLADIIKIK
jgi:hypothetical protein